MGGAPLSSIKLGEKNNKDANIILNQVIFFLGIIGFILTIVTFVFTFVQKTLLFPLKIYSLGTIFTLFTLGLNPFINAQGYALISMSTTLIGAICNLCLDPIFIYGLSLGVKGASIATIISQFISFIFVITFFLRKKSIYKYNFKEMIPNKIVFSVILLGLSPFIMQVTESAIQIVFSVCLKKVTNSNSDYTATMTILLSALQFISYPLNGFSNGCAPFVSYNYGAKNKQRVNKAIKFIAISSLIYTLIVYIVSMIYPELYAFIFSASENVTLLIKQYGRIFLMGTVMFFAQMSLQNTFIALNQAKISIFLACLRKVILLIRTDMWNRIIHLAMWNKLF
ncbi:MAG: hypothetical protein BHW64_06720 [Candidatus Melainabacteria bacterium LEY3_CP_29_8]|nr:MAG: hypothetical protein BHW64_06720 [Candidatus Melainabacteria bacterium LEY3_CP_29_8]